MLREEMYTSPHPSPRRYLQLVIACKGKFSFFPMESQGIQTTPKGSPHNQLEMANTKWIQQYFLRVPFLSHNTLSRHFLKPFAYILYFWSLCFFRISKCVNVYVSASVQASCPLSLAVFSHLIVCFVLFWFYFQLFLYICSFSNEREKEKICFLVGVPRRSRKK